MDMSDNRGLLRRVDDSGVPRLISRLVLAGTFLYTGSAKIADPVDFLKQIRMFQMLPESPPVFLNASAIVIPWLEVVVGTALLIGLHVRGAAAASLIMLCTFTPAILLRALAVRAQQGISFFDVKFACGCAGSAEVIIWTKLLANLGLVALAFVVLFSRSNRFLIGPWLDRHLAPVTSYE
jgi:uncharacterized membrane protein YphA (DoxX/SURF4 family)